MFCRSIQFEVALACSLLLVENEIRKDTVMTYLQLLLEAIGSY
jgi:hypothetical protein